MNETVAVYRMNPATDEIRFGDELAEGMWVLADDEQIRKPYGDGEDERIRAQRFRRVTRLRWSPPPVGGAPAQVVFVGEWVDGYQQVHQGAVTNGWIVKKDAPEDIQPDAAGPDTEDSDR